MKRPHSDALVFFGASGDLAYKKIFPSLYSLVRRGRLDCPIIGVARSGWGPDELRNRAKESIEKHGNGIDEETFGKLASLFRYVDGDYREASTFEAIHRALGGSRRPTHYGSTCSARSLPWDG